MDKGCVPAKFGDGKHEITYSKSTSKCILF